MDLTSKKSYSVLFLNRFGEALGERGVQKMLRKYLKRAGIGRASIHTLRHTFGDSPHSQGLEPTNNSGGYGAKRGPFGSDIAVSSM